MLGRVLCWFGYHDEQMVRKQESYLGELGEGNVRIAYYRRCPRCLKMYPLHTPKLV